MKSMVFSDDKKKKKEEWGEKKGVGFFL